MSYIYHKVPSNMTGTVLYPLNDLQGINEPIYDAHARKYERRQHLTLERNPILQNCLWGDVIFFIAVHPCVFWSAYESVGFSLPQKPIRTFQFAVETLDPNKLAVISKMELNRPTHYERFELSLMDTYSIIPQETYDYWESELRLGNKHPLLFNHIPHILYHGSLDTIHATVLEI